MIPANAPIGVRSKPMATSSDQNLLPLDGTLSKYTNVMKGWQNRYFFLNPQQGVLEYHVSQAEAFSGAHRPRGILQLAGAVISPSMDDSYTFSVNAANSEVYKLRASDAKQRQHWVSHLRVVANHFTQQIAQEHPPITGHQGSSLRKPRSISNSMSNIGNKIKDAADQVQQKTASTIAKHRSAGTTQSGDINVEGRLEVKQPGSRPRSNSRSSMHKSYGTNYNSPQLAAKRSHRSDTKELRDVKETLVSADNYYAGLVNMLDTLPCLAAQNEEQEEVNANQALSALDEEVLTLKSTSAATLRCLNECYNILQQHQHRKMAGLPPGAQISWMQPRDFLAPSSGGNMTHDAGEKSISNYSGDSMNEELVPQEPNIDPSEEVVDTVDRSESDLGTVEKHKSLIMHLLSQLKLGMDLTRVTLPTFILEKQSLLEMYADFLAHPELFLAIPSGPTPRERMIRVVKYYLTSFHCGRKGQLAKKPYNPIVGETFQCSYYVAKTSDVANVEDQTPPGSETHFRVRYTSEQVSHHPPVSAFYADCPEREICMNTHIWTKSKFMNMSIGVVNIGEGLITLTGHKERYVVSFPSAFARSILTTPWMELGGRCTITCDQTNLATSVTFHTKPMYGGQPHKISAEVKDVGTGSVFCRVEGEWNGVLNFTSTTADGSQKTELIDTDLYKGHRKYVRPLNLQTPMESRNLWKNVTSALMHNDVTTATEHKTILENSQRKKEKQRLDSGQSVGTIMFRKNGDSYFYKSPLCGS